MYFQGTDSPHKRQGASITAPKVDNMEEKEYLRNKNELKPKANHNTYTQTLQRQRTILNYTHAQQKKTTQSNHTNKSLKLFLPFILNFERQ